MGKMPDYEVDTGLTEHHKFSFKYFTHIPVSISITSINVCFDGCIIISRPIYMLYAELYKGVIL